MSLSNSQGKVKKFYLDLNSSQAADRRRGLMTTPLELLIYVFMYSLRSKIDDPKSSRWAKPSYLPVWCMCTGLILDCLIIVTYLAVELYR